MKYVSNYKSFVGDIVIASDDIGLIGIWFKNQKHFALNLGNNYIEKETKIIKDTKKWLDIYFSGKNPSFDIPIHFIGTNFQKDVWHLLCTIPYGKTMSYREIAKIIANKKGIKSMSSQAVGGAVSHNPVSIIVPCHRVIGSNGNLIGYAGGLDKKIELLKLEKIIIEKR